MAGLQRIAHSGEHRLLGVPQGLHILRYARSAAAEPPSILITPSADAQVEIISADPRRSAVLTSPGEALVLRSLGARSSINLFVQPTSPMGSRDAELRLEPVSPQTRQSSDGMIATLARHAPEPARAWSANDIAVTAHVSRRGDVLAKVNEWICGPELPMVIEGLQLDWANAPRGLSIRCSVESALRTGIRSFSGGLGDFVGSRRKAAPIIRVAFALEGPEAANTTLSLDALFLGSAIQSKSGRLVQLTGPSGREPLVGLRIGLARNERNLAPMMPGLHSPALSPQMTETAVTSNRVRVFRTLRKDPSTQHGLK
jgi:hypothetical protein